MTNYHNMLFTLQFVTQTLNTEHCPHTLWTKVLINVRGVPLFEPQMLPSVIGPLLISLLTPRRRAVVWPLQRLGSWVRKGCWQAKRRGFWSPAGKGGRHRGDGPCPGVWRSRIPHHQVFQRRREGVPERVLWWLLLVAVILKPPFFLSLFRSVSLPSPSFPYI